MMNLYWLVPELFRIPLVICWPIPATMSPGGIPNLPGLHDNAPFWRVQLALKLPCPFGIDMLSSSLVELLFHTLRIFSGYYLKSLELHQPGGNASQIFRLLVSARLSDSSNLMQRETPALRRLLLRFPSRLCCLLTGFRLPKAGLSRCSICLGSHPHLLRFR